MENINMGLLGVALNIAVLIVSAVGGWFMRMMFDRISQLETADRSLSDAVTDLRVQLPTHYVNKGEFQQMGNSIFEMLRRIEEKIDKKADKDQRGHP